VDDLIKSSGYRIGPFEIESVIMELPYVLECGVSAAPDPIRGQVVKASIVLTKGTEGTDELKKEIQNHVKHRTAPYKYRGTLNSEMSCQDRQRHDHQAQAKGVDDVA
jgi:acetyl-CoA synthetase